VYSGMTLKWDYKNRTCDISMPGYVYNVLSKFQHDVPKYPQHTPSRYVTPVHVAKTQYATKYETPPLTAIQCLTIQKITGSVLYYARAVYPTVLMPLNDIALEQTKATKNTQAATNQLLDYLSTHPDATIRYHVSDMILHIHSDASYLSVSSARSRLGGLFFLGNKPPEQDKLDGPSLMLIPSSKTWLPLHPNQKLERAFTMPKVELCSVSHSLSWVTYSPRRLSEQITPMHTAS
jgi:hypothetical protein